MVTLDPGKEKQLMNFVQVFVAKILVANLPNDIDTYVRPHVHPRQSNTIFSMNEIKRLICILL